MSKIRPHRLMLLGLLVLGRSLEAGENLVPANQNLMFFNDQRGMRWDIQQDGSINDGNNDCFDGAMFLHINGQRCYQQQQPMMTADGAELVLELRCQNSPRAGQNLRIVRRIRPDPKLGAVRYIDMVTNTTGAEVTVQVMLCSSTGGNCQNAISTGGRANPTTLENRETGVIGVQQADGQRPSVLWVLARRSGKEKPQLLIQNNRTFNFTWALKIPANASQAVTSTISQMPGPVNTDAKNLAELTRPFEVSTWIKDVPAEVRKALINAPGGGGGSLPYMPGSLTIEQLEVEPGDFDLLAAGQETRLQGQAECQALSVDGRFGLADCDFNRIAAIVGRRHASERPLVLLRDGQVLAGAITAKNLRFTLANGQSVPLAIDTLDRLILRRTPAGTLPNAFFNADPQMVLATGERLILDPADKAMFQLVTPWGPLKVPLEDIFNLTLAPDGGLAFQVTLTDGSRFSAFLGSDRLKLKSRQFGEHELSLTDLVGIVRPIMPDREDENPVLSPEERIANVPHVVLGESAVLAGRLAVDSLDLTISGLVLPLDPRHIRTLRRRSSAATTFDNLFLAELTGGGTALGHVLRSFLPISVRDCVLQVPVNTIQEVVIPQAAK